MTQAEVIPSSNIAVVALVATFECANENFYSGKLSYKEYVAACAGASRRIQGWNSDERWQNYHGLGGEDVYVLSETWRNLNLIRKHDSASQDYESCKVTMGTIGTWLDCGA